jgi:hypothetical protein
MREIAQAQPQCSTQIRVNRRRAVSVSTSALPSSARAGCGALVVDAAPGHVDGLDLGWAAGVSPRRNSFRRSGNNPSPPGGRARATGGIRRPCRRASVAMSKTSRPSRIASSTRQGPSGSSRSGRRAGVKEFSSRRSKIATRRSCSISGVGRARPFSSISIWQMRFMGGSAFPGGSDGDARRRGGQGARRPSRISRSAGPAGRARQAVRLKAFGLRQTFGGGADGFQRLGGHLRQRGALQEVEDREAGGKPGRARGGQDVVRAADVVADGLGRVGAQEDRAGMGDLWPGLGIGGAKLQMFGGDAVGQRCGLGRLAGDDDRAVLRPAGPGDGAAVQRLQPLRDGLARRRFAEGGLSVIRIDCALSSCSAWLRRSSAIQSGSLSHRR